tara:strand:- start:68 stop:1321 length:1254 start_codon:yes stop_codon:yes gene_type:complete
MDCSAELQDKIDKELTYAIPTHNPLDPPLMIKNMGIIRNGLVSIPAGRIDLIPTNYDIVDKRVNIPVDFPEFRFELRPSQKEVYDKIEDNAIINAWVSWGKTFTGLAIAGKLGQKTLVVTHTVALRNQWAKEVKKVYGFEPGIIGSGRFELDAPIVIGNTQTLYRNLDKIRKEFGTIILDEMHHVSSPTFSKVLDTNHCRYKIGLSGTIERKDGKHVVFRDYFGNTLFQPPKENYMTPTVHTVHSEIRFMDGAKTPWANRVTKLSNDEEYRHTVSMLAAAYAARGHKVLVVSDRVSFLKACSELTGDRAVCVTGDVSHEEREALVEEVLSGNKNVLYGTQSIFSEGISVDSLSCLILGTPVNNEPLLTQLVGRVIRLREGKIDPVVVDIHLRGNTARKQASNRMGFYMKQGWEIKYL